MLLSYDFPYPVLRFGVAVVSQAKGPLWTVSVDDAVMDEEVQVRTILIFQPARLAALTSKGLFAQPSHKRTEPT
jgi:hypothetical protein